MKSKGIDLSSIEGISGSAQQHGSVYLNSKFEVILKELNQKHSLASQIENTLARKTSPIWMDRSTHKECVEFINEFKDKVQKITGSPPTERFIGPQVKKFYKESKKKYDETKYIHLVSSFIASLMIGKSAPLDFSDASGTNLFDLLTLNWNKEIVEFTAPGLLEKLPTAVPSNTIIGEISPYFLKYGFSPRTKIVAFAGDNPSSLVGTGSTVPGTGVISLGTSDTFCCAIEKYQLDPMGYGHIFVNPAGGFMELLCFTNGSLAREKVKDEFDFSWEDATKLMLEKTKPGNEGNFMLPYFVPESVPLILHPRTVLIGTEEFKNGKERPEVKLRAILESQILAMRLHSGKLDLKKIRVTGGASKNSVLCQILADVFKIELERISATDSAALGAALRAIATVGQIPFVDLYAKFTAPIDIIKPNKENFKIYETLLSEYEKSEANYKSL